jgi:pimeloyl-ACP methyl ester carboxylesterase
LHGSGANHHYFAPLAEHLGQRALVIPSLPGRCGSDGTPPSTPAEAARWVREVLCELDLPPVVVVGHSYGGAIALELALMQAALPAERRMLDGLVVISSGSRLSVDPRHRDMLSPPGSADLRDVVRALALTPMVISACDFAACDGYDRTDAVSRIAVPTLVLAGADDLVAPVQHAHDLARRISGSRFVELPGLRHHPPLEATAEVAGHILSFVAGLDAPRAASPLHEHGR